MNKEQMSVDLSTKANSMTGIIQANHSKFDACQSVAELVDTIKSVFAENELDTTASRRLLLNVSKKRDFASALMTVYDSMLYGSKLGVNQK